MGADLTEHEEWRRDGSGLTPYRGVGSHIRGGRAGLRLALGAPLGHQLDAGRH
jgi:hypothetical protein